MAERHRVGRRRPAERSKGTTGQKKVLGPRERRRAIQLVVCLALFLAVFVGKGIFPQRLASLRQELLELLQTDTDFQSAFSQAGASISQGEPVLDTLEGLWVDVFAGGGSMSGGLGSLAAAQAAALSGFGHKTGATLVNRMPEETPALAATPAPTPTPVSTPEPTATPAPTPTPGPVPTAEHVDYTGPALPANTSMDKYDLALGETVSPVVGVLTSSFGWREHPVDGEEKFHNGVDLAVNMGTQVLAFAAGTVDYIGDSPDDYGLYLQIDHGNGVKSFYAHCSQLLVRQGQTVAAGEAVALSGDSGKTTGPHLHLELKVDGVRINPIYYIETG